MASKKKSAKKTAAKKSATSTAKVEVENVNHPGYTSTVDAAKYTTVRAVMLKVLPKSGGLTQTEMVAAVKGELTGELRAKAGWWTKCVQLDLEAKKLVVRDGGKPLRWRRVR